MSRTTSSRKKKKSAAEKIPRIPKRILSGREPMVERYTGKWQPLENVTRLATAEDLEKITVDAENALEEARYGIASSEPGGERIKWFGRVYELAQSIKNDHDQGHLGTISLDKAFSQACVHYIQPDGKPFTARSLRESLRQIQDKALGQPS
jgi:hypothetical protein